MLPASFSRRSVVCALAALAAGVALVPSCKDDEEEAAGEAKPEGAAGAEGKEEQEKAGAGEAEGKEEAAAEEEAEAARKGETAAKDEAAEEAEAPAKRPGEARGEDEAADLRPSRPRPGAALEGEEAGGAGAPDEAAGEGEAAATPPVPGRPGLPGDVPSAGEGGEALDPDDLLAQRRAEREKRIAELKARNEERRAEAMGRPAGAAPGRPTPGDETEGGEEEDEEGAGAGGAPGSPAAPPGGATIGGAVPLEGHLVPAGSAVLEIGRFLTIADVRTLTGDRTLAPAGGLSGILPGETYNSLYFAPPVRVNFGLSLQVWKEKTRRDANERYTRMRRDYANAEDTPAVPPKSFVSYWNDILTLTFTDLTKRVIVSVSCNQSICTPEELVQIASTVNSRL